MFDFIFQSGYIALFLISFLAATILPIGSEVLFSTMIVGNFDIWSCIIMASIGNWLGGMTNYYLGKLGKTEWIEKYLKINHEKTIKIQLFLSGRGAAMAFFCFLPIVGDIIAIALGYMRANIYIVNITMFLGKFMRYVLFAYTMHYLVQGII